MSFVRVSDLSGASSWDVPWDREGDRCEPFPDVMKLMVRLLKSKLHQMTHAVKALLPSPV